jgi:hypothetical protein
MKEPLPVEHRIVVPLAPAEAFGLFTRGISRWWPFKGHSCAEGAYDVEFEPRVGGAVTEIGTGGSRHTWGTLTQWQPPAAFAMTWHPAQPQAQATRLQVRFIQVPQGCEVHLIHDGWAARGAQALESRNNYDGGWVGVLRAYGIAADSSRPRRPESGSGSALGAHTGG